VIRTRLDVWFASERWRGRLDDLPVRRGGHKELGFGAYRKSRPLRQRVTPWFLATDLDWGWRKVCSAYGLRMQIEELFRDHKSLRYGWGLRQIELSEPGRLERLLLVLAFAYLCLVLMGLASERRFPQSHWASATSPGKRQASAFFIGRFMHERHRFRLKELLILHWALHARATSLPAQRTPPTPRCPTCPHHRGKLGMTQPVRTRSGVGAAQGRVDHASRVRAVPRARGGTASPPARAPPARHGG